MANIKPFNDMVKDSLRYLSQNTDISYFANGSIAKALVEASNLEISRLQEFINSSVSNSFISTASGIYLDLFGEMLGFPRLRDRRASVQARESILRFYVTSGTLGSRLTASTTDPNVSIIPSGTTIQNLDGSIKFVVSDEVSFPSGHKYTYVTAVAESVGAQFNCGANQLTVHSLGNSEIKVTNDIAITSGGDLESDTEYRFRLSRAMTAKFGSNLTAVELASLSQPGVSRVEVLEFARGAGTFDVLLVPQGNKVSRKVLNSTKRAVEQVVAFGISPRIKEPEYVPVKLTVQLTYTDGTLGGVKLNAATSAQSAVLQYLGSISLGGELIINQLRSAILSSDPAIKDLQIIELCVDNQPRVIRNIKLNKDELFIPCEDCDDPINIF